MALRLRLLDNASAGAWDRFVAAVPDGTFFHRATWSRVIESAFNHRSHYVFAEQDGAITGVLPLVHIKSKLFGSKLISTPFCVYGGPLAVNSETAAELDAFASALRERLGAPTLEMRERQSVEGGGLVRSDLYATFRKPIWGDDAINMKAIPRKQRAMVRKGVQNRLVSVCNRDVAAFYRVYSESVRNLGNASVFSPVLLCLARGVRGPERYRDGTGCRHPDRFSDEFLLSR
jgi:FemAB-related protein (PEP-CTERM system-associated)